MHDHGRRDLDEAENVAPIERKLIGVALFHHLAQRGSLRLQQRNITGNRDGFVLAADRKGNVHPGRLLNEDDDVFPVYALESGLFNGKAIVAGD